MSKAEFTRADIDQALSTLGLKTGDVIFSHSNIGFFGRPVGVKSAEEASALFLDAIRERIGAAGTFVVPTFTYSFPNGEVYEPASSPSKMGLLAEYVRRRQEALRSLDPIFSVAAIGARAAELVSDLPENSFGPDSFFERFLKADGRILNLNFDAGSTFIHYVERELRAPYRFDKTFTGRIRVDGVERPGRATIWVRYLSDDSLAAAFEGFDEAARAAGAFRTVALGRGQMGVISARDCLDIVKKTLTHRPWFLPRAER